MATSHAAPAEDPTDISPRNTLKRAEAILERESPEKATDRECADPPPPETDAGAEGVHQAQVVRRLRVDASTELQHVGRLPRRAPGEQRGWKVARIAIAMA